MDVKRIAGLLALALVVWFVVTQPAAAASMVQNIFSMLGDAANSVTSFVDTLV